MRTLRTGTVAVTALLVALAGVLAIGLQQSRGALAENPVVQPADTQPPTPGQAAALGPGPGQWQHLRVAAPDLPAGQTREVLVFTPPVADADRIPVVYLLHGEPGHDSDVCTDEDGPRLMDAFRAGAEPFILACPDGNPAAQADTEWGDSLDGRTALETFVTVDVIKAVEGHSIRPRGMRAITGFSMGGFGAAAIALRHPDLYSQVATFAGYFHLDDPDTVFGTTAATQAAHDPTALLDRATSLRWYLGEAAQDQLALTAHDSERYAALLRSVGAPVDLVIRTGPHAAWWATGQLPDVAGYFSSGWALA